MLTSSRCDQRVPASCCGFAMPAVGSSRASLQAPLSSRAPRCARDDSGGIAASFLLLALVCAALPTQAQEAPAVMPRLPVDLSPWGMFNNADIVVKAVMIGLAAASVVTWTVWLVKTLELASAWRQARQALVALEDAPTLAEATVRVGSERATVPALVRAASTEVRLSGDLLAKGVKERVVSRLERIEAAAGRSMTRGTGILATIGSTAPFIGLFGTVWGIMNSFIGISKAQTTNLAVVA
ncbi:tonB-system energizer ExbB, partial [Vineibacter terrae]